MLLLKHKEIFICLWFIFIRKNIAFLYYVFDTFLFFIVVGA